MKRTIIPELFDRPFARHTGNGEELEVPDSVNEAAMSDADRDLIETVFGVYNKVNIKSVTALELLTNILSGQRKKPREVIIAGRIIRKISDLPLKKDGIGSNLDLEDEEWRFLKETLFFPSDTKGKDSEGNAYEKDDFGGFMLNAQSGPLLEAIEDAVKIDEKVVRKGGKEDREDS